MTPQSLKLRDTIWLQADQKVHRATSRRKLIDVDKIEEYFDKSVYAQVTTVRNSITVGRYKKD